MFPAMVSMTVSAVKPGSLELNPSLISASPAAPSWSPRTSVVSAAATGATPPQGPHGPTDRTVTEMVEESTSAGATKSATASRKTTEFGSMVPQSGAHTEVVRTIVVSPAVVVVGGDVRCVPLLSLFFLLDFDFLPDLDDFVSLGPEGPEESFLFFFFLLDLDFLPDLAERGESMGAPVGAVGLVVLLSFLPDFPLFSARPSLCRLCSHGSCKR